MTKEGKFSLALILALISTAAFIVLAILLAIQNLSTLTNLTILSGILMGIAWKTALYFYARI